MEPYRDSIEHLLDELKRVDLLVRRALVMARGPRVQTGTEEFRGLVISEPQIDDLLESGEFLTQHWRKQEAAHALLDPLDTKLQELRESIDARRAEAIKAGHRLTLPAVAERFGLSAAEVDLLLIAMAPEMEPRYETLYAYLQDDVTRKRPSVDLALNLICRSEREKVFARRLFAPGAPLLHFRLVELLEEPHDRQPTLLRRFLKIEEPLLRFLLEQAPTAPALGSFLAPRITIDALEADDATRTRLRNLVDGLQRAGTANTVVRVIGSSRPELEAAAEALGRALQRPLIRVEQEALEKSAESLQALIRDAALLDAALAVFASSIAAPEEGGKPDATGAKQWWQALDKLPGPVIALGPANSFGDLPVEARIWQVDLPVPDFEMRRAAWDAALAGVPGEKDPARLAEAFRFGGPQIRQAGSMAWGLAALRNPSSPSPSMDDLLEAGRSLASPSLSRFAITVEPRYQWDDLVLPEEKKQQLEQIAIRFQYRRKVQGEWGFGEKLSRGKGLNVLLTGPSGVGKSMAAEVLANALSLTLFQIDLSTVVSKYIGDTERHLSAIFREAEVSQNLLFFDEADALFGKRTEVKDAHDRYANLEVNYLLQRIEQYEGVVVLATNLQRNLDEAFMRRMQEVVDFPFPDEALRERIWRRHLPKLAPVDEANIDFGFLARQFKLAGGSIKNAVVTAAFLAASRGTPIGMTEMIQAVRMELQKQGKLVMKTDFGSYFDTAQAMASHRPV